MSEALEPLFLIDGIELKIPFHKCCNKTYKNEVDYIKHREHFHSQSMKKCKYICNSCNLLFHSRKDFRSHNKIVHHVKKTVRQKNELDKLLS